MKPLTLIKACFGPLLYIVAAALLAALVAYPVFVLSGSVDISFLRSLVSRGGQVWLLLGILLLRRSMGVSWASIGFGPRFLPQLGLGLLIGIVMLSLHVLGLVLLGVREVVWPRLDFSDLLPTLGKALATGLGVALLEEIMFRGAMITAIRNVTGPFQAVVISAFYYAALHFIGTKWAIDYSQIGWDTGFRIAMDGFAHLLLAPPDGFLGLLVAGLLLGSIRVMFPQSIGLCIGMHAGWVSVIKTAKPLTYVDPKSPFVYMVSRYDYFVGYLSAAWLGFLLILMLGVLWILRQYRTSESCQAAG